jgi:hypothetical protein
MRKQSGWQRVVFYAQANAPTVIRLDARRVGEFATVEECRAALEKLQDVALDGMRVRIAAMVRPAPAAVGAHRARPRGLAGKGATAQRVRLLALGQQPPVAWL